MKCTLVCTVPFCYGQFKLIQPSNSLQVAYQTVQSSHSSLDLIQVLPVQAAIYSHTGVAMYLQHRRHAGRLQQSETCIQLSSKVVSRVRSRSVLDYRRAHRCRAIRCCDSGQVYDLCSDACGD